MSYCDYCKAATTHPVHVAYHDTEYGFPCRDDSVVFERLVLEINQAGLSWETILKKREGFTAAYSGFDVDRIAGYGERDVERVLADPGVIRNRLKVAAAVHNAKVAQRLIQQHGTLASWLDSLHPLPLSEWVKVFRKEFKFMGGEIVGEFLMSLGYLPGTHDESCQVFATIRGLQPPFLRTGS